MATSVSGMVESHNSLPEFVFPARASPSSSAPASFSRVGGNRRPASVAELPSFSFNPSGAISPESGMASPPLSPNRAIPSRPGFHKRGTSEFIGGDGKSGSGLGLMSTSPTKGDGVLPPPNPTSSLGPVIGRRGHQHRRSAAISAHDLGFILKPSDPNTILRGGSAPCTPSGNEHTHSPFPGTDQLRDKEMKRSESESSIPAKATNRARVGFSDDIQFIPRPLSLVSSESSGTTIRAGSHSVSGSLSSIISPSSPPSKDQSVSPNPADIRPKTAAARLDSTRAMSPTPHGPSPRRHRSNPLLADLTANIPPASPSSPKSPAKKWTFFGYEESPPQSRPTSSASSKELQTRASEPSSPLGSNPDLPIVSTELSPSRRSSASRKPGKKKQKKVKSWAGSILSRKSRQRSQKQSRRSPTPPLRSFGSLNEPSGCDLGETADNNPPPKPEINTDFSSWVPRRVQTYTDESSMSPIIDLDAALGPFNTPSVRDAEWDAVNGGSETTKKGRRMHSAAGMGNFGGPGMHYHRRAQSSPEFENPRLGIRHLHSSSTMADVFEEDEEEDGWEDAKTSDRELDNKPDDDEEGVLGIDIKVVDAENMSLDKPMDWTIHNGSSSMRGVKRKGSGLSEGDRRHLGTSMKSTASSTSLQEEIITEESPSPIAVLDDSTPRRPESRAQSSDSTATPPFRAHPAKELAPVDIQPFTLQPPYLTPTSPHSTTYSSLPSPRSPFSYDTQRISTAPSSVTDEGGFQSLLLGEPGPELRMSVDDVPSLTSSNSTMTRDSNSFPMVQGAQFRDGQRSASLSSAAVTRKRSSIASLSRLISSSHGEKSKLSIESRAPSMTENDKKEKGSKSKRISRMMQFWKPKEAA